MTGKKILYWATTGLLSAAMLMSGIAYLSGAMEEARLHLGYPAHFMVLLGSWKLLVAPALLVPGLLRLKDLAYAGLFFTFTGAAFAHIAVGDGAAGALPPFVMLALAATSFWLVRPVRFGGADAYASATVRAAAA